MRTILSKKGGSPSPQSFEKNANAALGGARIDLPAIQEKTDNVRYKETLADQKVHKMALVSGIVRRGVP